MRWSASSCPKGLHMVGRERGMNVDNESNIKMFQFVTYVTTEHVFATFYISHCDCLQIYSKNSHLLRSLHIIQYAFEPHMAG